MTAQDQKIASNAEGLSMVRLPKQLLHVPVTMAIFSIVVAFLANSFWLSAATSAVALSLSVSTAE